jgi:signal transduction histidine kinase
MPDPRWYQSLYWRIALGFVGVLACVLTAQAIVFVWVSGRAADVWPGRTPAEYAQLIAVDVATALIEQPGLDLDGYVNERFPGTYRAFVVVTGDRRTVYSRAVPGPPMMGRAALSRLGVEAPASLEGGRGGRGRGGRGSGSGGSGGLGGDGARQAAFAFAPIRVSGSTVGMVAVSLAPPPLSAAISNLGPTLAVQALVMLCVGALLVALIVFGPARRRLRGLQAAVTAVGAGRHDVRAPAGGGDEVAALAHAFNEMAQALEERTRALTESDRVRRQLLADVSHELGTPLAAIRGYVETLSMPGAVPDDATRDRYLGIVGQETERLGRIVGDLLDLARMEGGGQTFHRAVVPVLPLFRRVLDRHEPSLQSLDIEMRMRVEPESLTVVGDGDRLEQALQNLAANAIRHTSPGGHVDLRAAEEAGVVVLTVDDCGPGVPPEHLDRVFDRFYKVDAARAGTTVPSGSGLGLSIVRAIVGRHGGTVTVANRSEGGARFTVRLPSSGPTSAAGAG